MIATDSPCLTADQLRDLAVGRLPGDRFTRLLDHLDACPECQQRAEAIQTPDDSLAAALAMPPQVDPHAAEADCIAVLHACSAHHPGTAESSAPPIQQLGQYRLIRALGSGGMGAVYLASHTRLRRQCAIKLLPRARGFDTAWRDRFDREMAAVAALNDPHIVSASDAGEAAGWHYLVMEYLDGLDLSRLAARVDRLSVADACELMRQAAVGLAHIHAAGLVHRDIKPSNLMLTRDGVVKILDLGLVLSGTDPLPTDDRLTTIGQLMGTLAYMAPEQLVDSTAVDDRADLYALGATLYRLLAGTAPHASSRGIAQLVIAKTAHAAPAITEQRSGIPTELAELIQNLLDRNPASRPESAAAVALSLQRYVQDANPKRLIAAALRRPPSAAETAASAPPLAAANLVNSVTAAPPRRRWRTMIAAAAAVPLLLLAGIAIVIMTDRGQLVIESEAAGLNVSIQQGEDVVEQLQLSTGDNRVTLRSGSYTVTLDAAADGLQLSDNTVTVTRGGETVLRVRRDESASSVADRPVIDRRITSDDLDDAGPRYQGQPLSHWLSVLETEREVKTVIEAMQAVVVLTRGTTEAEAAAQAEPSDRLKVAEAILRASRHYGGMDARGMGGPSSESESPSVQFMGHMLQRYSALLPNPGLQAISDELTVGTPESSMASIWVLNDYAKEVLYGKVSRPEFGELQRWGETPAGREKLNQLSRNIDTAVKRFGGYELKPVKDDASSIRFPRNKAVEMAYETRLKILEILDRNAFEDPAIAARLDDAVAEVAAYYQEAFNDVERRSDTTRSYASLPRLSAVETKAAVSKHDATTLAWAAGPSLFLSPFSEREFPQDLLRRLGEHAPAATADAIVALLSQPIENSFFGDGVRQSNAIHAGNAYLLFAAAELIARATTKPQLAITELGRMNNQLAQWLARYPQLQPGRDVLQSAIEQLATRMKLERKAIPLQSWLNVLKREQDVEKIIESMQAIAERINTESPDDDKERLSQSEREQVAESLLHAARRFGGYYVANPNTLSYPADRVPSLSARFMGHWIRLYSFLLPDPGLQMLSSEIATGTSESFAAAIAILRDYTGSGLWIQEIGLDAGALQPWANTAEGQRILSELSSHIDSVIGRTGGYELRQVKADDRSGNTMFYVLWAAYEVRIRINNLLGINSADDPVMGGPLKKAIEQAANYYQELSNGEQPSPDAVPRRFSLIEPEIEAALGNVDESSLAWAVGRPLFFSHFSNPDFPLELLQRLAREAPAASADSILGTLMQIEREVIVVYQILKSGEHEKSQTEKEAATDLLVRKQALLIPAIELIAKATTKPQLALSWLKDTRDTPLGNASRESAELRAAVQAAIEQLETRVE